MRFLCSLLAICVGLIVLVKASPQQHLSRRPSPVFKTKEPGLDLPNNATSIRENIVDTFSCKDRVYGYYADVENECQIFHVCLPQERGSIRWSFICPAETVFNQATFVCTRTENSIPCEESEQYYVLNEEIGKTESPTTQESKPSPEEQATVTPFSRIPRSKKGGR